MTGKTELNDWIGRQEQHSDVLRAQPARFLQATLGQAPTLTEGSTLPPLWHWLYFLDVQPAGALGRDGHPEKGGFLPPVDLPRRMWAGGRLSFLKPLRLGLNATKLSTIQSITQKQGRSGPLCFVTVRHEIFQHGECALREEHDIVYRQDPTGADRPQVSMAPPKAPQHSEQIHPTEVLLFRYSALTFNGHRIHYDIDYARQVEGYDGLVVHGPLTATLLAMMAQRCQPTAMTAFEFRGRAPLTGMAPFTLEGHSDGDDHTLWARRADGQVAMTAKARFAATPVRI